MTLDEIAYNLLNLIRGGRSNNDEHISLSQIKFNIKHYRAMLLDEITLKMDLLVGM